MEFTSLFSGVDLQVFFEGLAAHVPFCCLSDLFWEVICAWALIFWLSFTAAGPEVHIVSESEVESMRGFLWLIMEYA